MDDSLHPRSETDLHPRAGVTAAPFAPGQILANRYEIRRPLGRGAMGAVWLAFDLRLRVEVALKALVTAGPSDLLRREVRTAREVISPNVCRIFDLVEADGLELLSMEYVDGQTLRTILDERSPLDVRETQEIAVQFLAALEAIHAAGLVHRDFKPANVMITRAGRVVVMDFGLAKPALGAGSFAGTPVYMAPEQLRGEATDRRADIFAAGVVLAEMIDPEGVRDRQKLEQIWSDVRRDPVWLPDTRWTSVLRRCLRPEPDERYPTASVLARALEDASQRLGFAEEKSPYPGLASFTEADADYFFGREAEVEAMWRKLTGPPRLLALIGPSGAGKSSFVRAGLLPAQPEEWRILITTPGNRPFAAVARALAPNLSGDIDAIGALAEIHDPDVAVKVMRGWRGHRGQALLIVDQLEELFTLNSLEVQDRFAELLSRLTTEADVHVLLSLRDDFLIRCHDHAGLAPVFAELTPLKAPTGEELRRAMIHPALTCGYRFEDEKMVDEILEQISGERGALPLAAFAMARLWEKRDRQRGVLPRAAYEAIGGVGGALAQHAETTLERIGVDRTSVVREIFRNLVTAHGTRVAREREELVCLFVNQVEAAEVLATLINARLLTSYEVDEAHSRIEIIHESLLKAWPRLVRWQAQDAEGALLRDQLRQAAQLWQDRGRTEDVLWSGSAYREFAVWRSRYSGTLSSGEEAFAKAMVSAAERRKRRMRLGIASVVTILVAVAGILALLLRRSERSEEQARAETRRAEAQKLLALSQVELDRYPTAALAYVSKSLELADTPEARMRVMEILWRGPIARILPIRKTTYINVTFSPDGRWLAACAPLSCFLISADGTSVREMEIPVTPVRATPFFSDDSQFLAVGGDETVKVFSVAEGKAVRTIPNPSNFFAVGARVITMAKDGERNVIFRAWPFSGGDAEILGRSDSDSLWQSYTRGDLDPTTSDTFSAVSSYSGHGDGSSFVFPRDTAVYQQITTDPLRPPELLWNVDERILRAVSFERGQILGVETGNRISLRLRDGTIRSLEASAVGAEHLTRPLDFRGSKVAFAALIHRAYRFFVWDLEAPRSTSPFAAQWPKNQNGAALDPSGAWVATPALADEVAFWPLEQPLVRTIADVIGPAYSRGFLFTPDSRYLLSCGTVGGLKRWSLGAEPPIHFPLPEDSCRAQAMNARDSSMIAGDGEIFLISRDGRIRRRLLSAFEDYGGVLGAAAFDATGEVAVIFVLEKKSTLRIMHVKSGKMDLVPIDHSDGSGRTFAIKDLGFGSDGMLYSAGNGGVRRWNLAAKKQETFRSAGVAYMAMSGSGRYFVAAFGEGRVGETSSMKGNLIVFDVQKGVERRITTHGSEFTAVAIDDSGEIIATRDPKGVVRVGKASGTEPHLLDAGLPGGVIAISPDQKWLATRTRSEIRLWPMPDLSKPPLHMLPHDQLMAKLKELTNLRAVRDETSSSGYKLEIGPFPGWQKAATW